MSSLCETYWLDAIVGDEYIERKEECKADVHSFNVLVDHTLKQGQNITLGNCMERFIVNIIQKQSNGYRDLRDARTKKGDHQTDHLWINEEKKEIIYAEQKNNINLDTEKSKNTELKVQEVHKKLVDMYPDYTVRSCILAARYLANTEAIAREIIQRKYKNTTVLGVNDYFRLFGMREFRDYDEYKSVINTVVFTKFGSFE